MNGKTDPVESGGVPELTSVAVVFGPSSSRRFPAALAKARSSADEVIELAPGTFRATFRLGSKLERYAQLGALLELVRHWRGSEVYVDELPVSSSLAVHMAWCASGQLRVNGACGFRFVQAVPGRCVVCPLFDRARAEREIQQGPSGVTVTLVAKVMTEMGDDMVADLPDFVPEEWEGRARN